MSSYANFNSPQFVDFLNNETFDINDGADHFFEEYFVGEGTRRVRSDEGTSASHDAFLAELKNMSLKNGQQQANKMDPLSLKSSHGGKVEDKENMQPSANDQEEIVKKEAEIVGTSAPSVGSALDLMRTAQSVIAQPVNRAPLIKTSSVEVNSITHQYHNAATGQVVTTTKQRTMSNTVMMSTPLLASKPNHAPAAHNGVTWVPKIAPKKPQFQQETPTMDNEKYSSSSKPKAPEQLPTNNPTRPIIAGSHDEKKPAMASGLTRATPGKSASMRGEKKPNLIKSLLMKPRQIPLASKPPVPHHHHEQVSEKPTEKKTTQTTSSSNLMATKSAHNTSSGSSSMMTSASNSSHVRKISENKTPLGFLHTELRAQKRHEFDAIMKEKERLAAQQRLAYEQEKQRQEQELIQRLRSQTTFKSQPVRHYKPIEIKPSEKALTSPKSPHLGALVHNSSLSNKKNSRLGSSHDDLGI